MNRFSAAALALSSLLAAAGAGAQVQIAGRAAETMDGGAYTHVRVEQGPDSTWVAVPKMKVEVGSEVAFAGGMVMTDFHSPTLNRDFKTIIFSEGPAASASKDPNAGMGAMGAMGSPEAAGGQHRGAAGVPKEPSAKCAKAEGPDAYTIAQLHAKRVKLAGKTVSVRGMVVKVSSNIMGRNWIHLQDGSGDAKAGDYDLTVTSAQQVEPGDRVTARGVVTKDVAFGMGYSYPVLLENASLQPAARPPEHSK
jgi:hypothetical protein